MYSIHVFAQYKLAYDTLKELPADEQTALDRAFIGSKWIKDANGNLLSSLLPLTMPQPGQPELILELPFQWGDSATHKLAQALSRPQLGLAPKVGRFRVETRLRSRVQHWLSLPVQGTG